jgi:hypothetical protein
MRIVSALTNRLQKSSWFFKFKIRFLYPLGVYDRKFLEQPLDEYWEKRIKDVLNFPDNRHIPINKEAGNIKGGMQYMHNGILTTAGGYYGSPIAQMLNRSKGIHEPQEEYVFQEILKLMPEGATMIELGAYWAFYSIWFATEVKNATNYMIEPGKSNIEYGVNNFRKNKKKGHFTNAYIGENDGINADGVPIVGIDSFVARHNISHINILHSDIQGYEYEMLCSARKSIAANKIDYFFISTHGDDVHHQCLSFLREANFIIICEAGEKDTYSVDGLIVARSPNISGPTEIRIAKKLQDNSNIAQ